MSLALEKNVSQTQIGFWRVEHAETEQRLPRSLTDSIHSPSDSMDFQARVATARGPGRSSFDK